MHGNYALKMCFAFLDLSFKGKKRHSTCPFCKKPVNARSSRLDAKDAARKKVKQLQERISAIEQEIAHTWEDTQAERIDDGFDSTKLVHNSPSGEKTCEQSKVKFWEEEEEGTLARLSVLGAPLNGGAMVVEMGNGGGKGG